MTSRDSPPYDRATAEAALWLLRDAHDRWLAEHAEVSKTHGGPEHHREVALRMHQHAASVLLWTRGLDDLCDDPDGLPSYVSARPRPAPLLDAARYALNRSGHQLLMLTRSVGGVSFPVVFPVAFNEVGIFRWAEEALLPPPQSEKLGQARFRAAYVAQFAGQNIGPTLRQLREWFDQQLGVAAAT